MRKTAFAVVLLAGLVACGAEGTSDKSASEAKSARQLGILTPKVAPSPRINGATVYGVRPGRPVLYRLPVTGDRPMTYGVRGLPKGLQFDARRGIVTGKIAVRGSYPVTFKAKNAKGETSRIVTFVVGDRIALTPPLGWNSWNCFETDVTEKDIREAAEALVKLGLADHGWNYVNIDDFWQYRPNTIDKDERIQKYWNQRYKIKDEQRTTGPAREADGTVVFNRERFTSMKGLADSVHELGLKIGLYSSPGPLTCGRCTGSYGFERKDAETWAAWGYDYVKYDWCGYRAVVDGDGLYRDMAPYILMSRLLAEQNRDIVLSICQYGMANVSLWGEKAGGQLWRTTGDIHDNWKSLRDIIGKQRGLGQFSGPGAWNDPDMLTIGWVSCGKPMHPTALTPNEQYTQMSMWALFAAPLLIGCDLTKIDDFTLSLLTNDEVLEIDQDPLGKGAERIVANGDGTEIWARPLADGAVAVGLCNFSDEERPVVFQLSENGMMGNWKARDVWRQRDEGSVSCLYEVSVPPHATHLVRFTPTRNGGLAPELNGDVREMAWRRLFKAPKPFDASAWDCKDCRPLRVGQ